MTYNKQQLDSLQKWIDKHNVIKGYLTGPYGYSVECNPLGCNVDDDCNDCSLGSISNDFDSYNYYNGFDGVLFHADTDFYIGDNYTDVYPGDYPRTCDPCGDKGEPGKTSITWTILKSKEDSREIILYDQLDQNNYLRF